MGIDLTTVSVSLDILTVNAEAGPDTLPLNIQAIDPIPIWTESFSGRTAIDRTMAEIKVVSKYADNYSPPVTYGIKIIPNDTKIHVENAHTARHVLKENNISIQIENNVAATREIPATFLTLNTSNANPSDYTQNPTNGTVIQLEDKTRILSNNHTNPTATDLLDAAGAFEMTMTNHTNQVADGSNPIFNELFDTPGTHSWTCPAGVSSVSVVCVGAGGNGGYQWSSGGGGGGGLGWKNNISVTAGQSYTVVVGDHGGEVANAYNATTGMGGNSYFISTSTVCGFGAGGGGLDYAGNTKSTGHGAHGGGYAGDGGGAGGNGAVGGSWTHGGGGAGGYSGDGASRHTNTSASGGGGGAGQYYSSTYGVGAGGGVGVHGEGTSGITFADGTGYGGKGGSGGGDGMAGESAERSSSNIWTRSALDTTTVRNTIVGGQYGGGGGGSGTTRGGGPGGTGAVKLVYKTSGSATLEFPSTNVGEIPTAGTTTTQVSDPIPVFVENPSHTYSRDEKINHIFKRLSIDTKLSENSNNFDYSSTNITYNPSNIVKIDSKRIESYGSGYDLREFSIPITATIGRNTLTDNIKRLQITTKNESFSNSEIMIRNFKPNKLGIVAETDKAATSPVFCDALQFDFRIKGTDTTEWGHFTDNHIKTMKVLTKFNDPRLTSGTSSGGEGGGGGGGEGGEGGGSGSGPIQSWSS